MFRLQLKLLLRIKESNLDTCYQLFHDNIKGYESKMKKLEETKIPFANDLISML